MTQLLSSAKVIRAHIKWAMGQERMEMGLPKTLLARVNGKTLNAEWADWIVVDHGGLCATDDLILESVEVMIA